MGGVVRSRNLSLAVMLMKDVFKSAMGKLHDIRHYYPEADPDDWVFIPAGAFHLRLSPFESCRSSGSDHQEGSKDRQGHAAVRHRGPT